MGFKKIQWTLRQQHDHKFLTDAKLSKNKSQSQKVEIHSQEQDCEIHIQGLKFEKLKSIF